MFIPLMCFTETPYDIAVNLGCILEAFDPNPLIVTVDVGIFLHVHRAREKPVTGSAPFSEIAGVRSIDNKVGEGNGIGISFSRLFLHNAEQFCII